ncbi:MAG: AAA family ATPase, partial [Bacteroidales bacterium]|nr:AAA family ATPase [Bacteroidales bacterium]
MAIKSIPYGTTDFDLIITENNYYVDKTGYIPMVEKSDRFFTFLRPRRFGKTLFLATLDAYYNVKYKDKFDFYFKDKKVYTQLTPKRNSYLVMKFDFSKVDNNIEKVYESFNSRIKNTLADFLIQYKEYFSEDIYKEFKNINKCDDALDYVLTQTKLANQKVYLIIDEYDNFANSLLSRNENDYISLTHGDGFFRLFFNILKAHTSG